MQKAEFLVTLYDSSQVRDALSGEDLKGRRDPRIAMVGRSNVGKSTLINALLGIQLARVSSRPGKTYALHFYLWKEIKKIVVDLPGYGFAKVAKDERKRWEDLITTYLENDQKLERALVLLDARRGVTDVDYETIEFLSLKGIPVTFVFVKADTLKKQSERALQRKLAQEAMKKLGVNDDAVFWVSSHEKTGLKELVRALSDTREGGR